MKAKSLILLMVLGSFINCKSQVKVSETKEIKETRAILSSYFTDAFENRGVYFNNRILQNHKGKHWSHLINPSRLSMVRNFNIKTESDIIHFETLFTEEDIEFLQKSARNFKIENWTEILDNKNIVDSSTSDLILSSPAFDRSFTYAIFYLGSRWGGDLIIFKKEGGEWVYFGLGMVWIS